jgi:hypothetical protein
MLLGADSASSRTVKRAWSMAGRMGAEREDASDAAGVDDTKTARG